MHYFLNIPFNTENMKRLLAEFECQRCNPSCCTGNGIKGEGIILLPREIQRMASLKGMSNNQFRKWYCTTKQGQTFMKFPCSFYSEEKNGCTIWNQKPHVCIQFPFNKPYKHKDGSLWMTCGNCAGGKIIGKKYEVRLP